MVRRRDTRTKHYEVLQVYPDFDQREFWTVLVDFEGWFRSDNLPVEISIVESGQGDAMGKGAVWASGRSQHVTGVNRTH